MPQQKLLEPSYALYWDPHMQIGLLASQAGFCSQGLLVDSQSLTLASRGTAPATSLRREETETTERPLTAPMGFWWIPLTSGRLFLGLVQIFLKAPRPYQVQVQIHLPILFPGERGHLSKVRECPRTTL